MSVLVQLVKTWFTNFQTSTNWLVLQIKFQNKIKFIIRYPSITNVFKLIIPEIIYFLRNFSAVVEEDMIIQHRPTNAAVHNL